MTELRNVEADARRFRLRVFVLGVVVLLAFLLIVARLLVLQVERHDDLAEQAESNRTAIVPIVPNRGLIMDRNAWCWPPTIPPTRWRSRPRARSTWRAP